MNKCKCGGCDRKAEAHGMCLMHYKRWVRHGDPNVVKPRGGSHNFKHGYAARGTSEYKIWKTMIQRCHNPNNHDFRKYGARGTRVCDEWRGSFTTFFDHVGLRPTSTHSLDRFPDKNGNYEPGNVRWATPVEQQRNKRTNVYLMVDGATRCIAEWSELTGINETTIHQRLRHGWTEERAVKTSVK